MAAYDLQIFTIAIICSPDKEIEWQRNTHHAGGWIANGYTHPPIKCWRSVVCTRSDTISICGGRRLWSIRLDAPSTLNVRGQTKITVRCPGGGGGRRRCAWTTFDLFGSCNWATLLSTGAEWPYGNALPGSGRCNWIKHFEVLVIPVDWPFGEGALVGGEKDIVLSMEPFNPIKQMTRQGWHMQRGHGGL